MRVLLSAYTCEPGRGSERGNGWNWAVHLVREGHDVHVLTRAESRPAVEAALAALEGDVAARLQVRYVGVPAWVRERLARRSQLLYLSWQHAALPSAQALHAVRPFDLVHHVTWGSLQGGSRLWRLGIPFVFGPVGGGHVAPPGFAEDFGEGWRGERLRTFVTNHLVPWIPPVRSAARHAALVLATNRDTLLLARRLGAPRVEMFAGPGLPDSFFPPSFPVRPEGDVLNLLWVGRLFARKAPLLALDALVRARAPVRLTVVGDGPEGGRLAEALEDAELRVRVDWWGQVPWERVKEAYRTHDALIFTSLRDSVGYQLFEAMAFGLPVIALDQHGARDLVPDAAGIKVAVAGRERTVAGLAAAIDRLQGDGEARRAMGRAGYQHAREHAWPRKAAAMSRLYESVVLRGQGR